MSQLGSLGSSPQFSSWIQSLDPASIQDALDALSSSSSAEDTAQSAPPAKIKDEDLLALMPPPPAMLQPINMNFSDQIGIDRASLDTNLSLAQSAIVLAAATSWSEEQINQSEAIQEILKSATNNTQAAALSNFFAQASIGGMDTVALQQIFRNSPVVSSLFRGADPALALKAYQLAEQQIVLTMLDNWVAMESQRAEAMRRQMKTDDIKTQEIAHKLLQDYVQNVSMQRELLTQPALSILVSAVVLGTSGAVPVQLSVAMTESAVAIMRIATETITASSLQAMPDPLKTEYSLLTSGLLSTVTGWATPVAMTLFSKSTSATTIPQESVRSFALTLSTFLTNRAVDNLFLARLQKAVESGLIPKGSPEQYLACLKISLLMNTLALLYATEYGGVTADELLAHFNGTFTQSSDLISLLVKLINEQQNNLPEAERGNVLAASVSSALGSQEHTSSLLEPIRTFLAIWTPDLGAAFSSVSKA